MITKHKISLKQTAEIILAILFILSIIITVQIAVDPTVQSMAVDSGLFAYCSQRIVAGELLYRDCWDNKPPGVYYLNALAILLGGSSHWGIWIFQTLWVAVTAFVFFLFLRKIWGTLIAFLVTGLFLFTLLYPGYYQSGNLTESYALVFIILTFAALYRFLSRENLSSLIGIGFFTACAFLLKPTYIMAGFAAAFVIFITSLQKHNFLRSIKYTFIILLSVSFPLLFVASYWVQRDAFQDLWFAVFTHNRLYVQQGLSLQSIYRTMRILLFELPLAALTAFALVGIIIFYISNWKKLLFAQKSGNSNGGYPGIAGCKHDDPLLWLMAALSISVVLDCLMAALSGKNFGHYFQVPMVSMAASSAYLFSSVIKSIQKRSTHKFQLLASVSFILILLITWSVKVAEYQLPGKAKIAAFINQDDIRGYQMNAIEEYIYLNSSPGNSVLLWAYDPTIYFVTGTRSPTRFIFLDHLFNPIPGSNSGFDVLLDDLDKDPPSMIAIEKETYLGLLYYATNKEEVCPSCSLEILHGLDVFREYVNKNYNPATKFSGWAIYKRNH